MGKYIYEGHMGSLFASDESLDFEQRYCEQCGDSDWEIGYAKDAGTAFFLLNELTDTFDNSKCEKCEHCEDYAFCDEECDEYAKSGGYSLSYVMNFLHSEFSDTDKFATLYLVLADDKQEGYVMVGFDKHREHKHFLPNTHLLSSYANNESFKNILSSGMLFISEGEPYNLEFCYEEISPDIHHIVYSAKESITQHEKETSHWSDDCWYGFVRVDELDITEEEMKIVRKVLKMSA